MQSKRCKKVKGAVLMTSHDREFMNRLVNRIVEVSKQQGKIAVVGVNGAGTSTFRVFEIDHGEMRIYNGHYDYYLEKNRGAGPAILKLASSRIFEGGIHEHSGFINRGETRH
jgi:ATPase subunit of ABC transporter with duplicated ATPase domains